MKSKEAIDQIEKISNECLGQLKNKSRDKKYSNESEKFLSTIEAFMEKGSKVSKMSDVEYDMFVESSELAVSGSVGAYAANQQQLGESETARCVREMKGCYEQMVPADAWRWPCASCVVCNLAYLACLAAAIV